MKISGIYCITNKLTGDKYIGSSINIKRRFIRHKTELRHNKHGNIILQRAYNKYSEAAFYFGIVEICDNIIEREQIYIYTDEFSYNICRIAGSPGSRPCSAETRAKLSAANKGKKHSEETKARMSAAGKGKPVWNRDGRKHSAETIAKIRASKQERDILRYLKREEII